MGATDILHQILSLFGEFTSLIQAQLSMAPSKAVVIVIGVGLMFLALGSITGLFDLHGMVYGNTVKDLQPFGYSPEADGDAEEWLSSVQLVKVYSKQDLRDFTKDMITVQECLDEQDSFDRGIVWESNWWSNVFVYIWGDEPCEFLEVASVDVVRGSNESYAGFTEDWDDFVGQLENGEICNETSGLTSPQASRDFAWEFVDGSHISSCWIPRDALTQQRIPLEVVQQWTGAAISISQYDDELFLLDRLAPQVDLEEVNYKDKGLLTPVIIMDKVVEGTVKWLDGGFVQLFNMRIFTPIYETGRDVIIWGAFLMICLLSATLVWSVASK